MKEVLKYFGAVFGVLFLIYVLVFFATGGNLAIYKFWAPKLQEARRDVFEQTQSYVHGKNSYIARLRLQYDSSSGGPQKEALRRLVITEAETIDEVNLTPTNQAFVNNLRRQ